MAIQVLVVDDSAFMRAFLIRLIEENKDLELVGTAKNGSEAVELVTKLHPQVVTMDIEMPVMNGLEALKRIMKECPTPVIMVSSLTAAGAEATIRALNYGAVDFVTKPSASPSVKVFDLKGELVSKIKVAVNANLNRPLYLTKKAHTSSLTMAGKPTGNLSNQIKALVAIGTSTGGPRALDTVLTTLPKDFPYPIVIVQHMPATFTRSLAERLNRVCQIRVVEAQHDQLLETGTAYIAPGGHHMEVVDRSDEYRVILNDKEPMNGHRPSVDVLFKSVAALKGIQRHLVIMTGMGNDGAKGMLMAKISGADTTIAEAKETCVVFGMPKSAIELNCVDYVIPLDKISKKIMEIT